ncbi:hypothetical protein [Magnetospirillum aberrantis]|uniref:Relaxase/mobilization nuclease domain-containing protein n=1 Tax=Magnetospirillum aberrantis SpK TaxID=908842 RepID=A0A7C9UXM2_9PROT|nr:hypothetical protein [Magnetospirillum aberrantis]NFV78994.1 hypothetical protein [Magnetospirillum aberrantis SpK]
MIVKATRIKAASGPRNLLHHLLGKPEENEEIVVIAGSPDETGDVFADAAKNGDRYAIRHAQFAPDQVMSRDDAIGAVRAYLAEFGSKDVDGDMRHVLVVEHQKKRADNASYDRHWHACIPERLPSTGRVMDSKMYARHERIARSLEIELGHQIRKGRHNKFVVESLREAGRGDIAAKLDGAEIAKGDLPQTAYTSDRVQIAKRQGRDLPGMRQQVKAAWSGADSADAFRAALAESGLTVEVGRKPGTWIVNDAAGKLVGSVDRLTGVKKSEVSARLGDGNPPPPKTRHRASAEADVHTTTGREERMADTATAQASGQVIPFTQGAAQGEKGEQQKRSLLQAIVDIIKRLFGLAGQYESRAVRPESPDQILQMVKEIRKEMGEMRSAIAEHRLAIDVLKDHDSRKPEGIKARLTGERREWEQDRQGYAADEQAKAEKVEEQRQLLEKAKAKWLPKATAKAEENAAENAADLSKAAALRHTAEALLAGDPKATEAAQAGKPVAEIVAAAKEWTPPSKAEAAAEANQAVEELNQAPGLKGFGRR